MTGAPSPVAVIGAGFSGTMAALHLLPRLGQRAILLCERGERFGRGVAYGTDDAWHLLNVRAANMSAFPDQPHHFLEWLAAQGARSAGESHETPAGTFVSRRLYGDYLTQLLNGAVTGREGATRLILVPDEAVDLVPEHGGYRLVLAGGVTHHVDAAVLALGNLPPEEPAGTLHVADPWTTPFTGGLRDGEPVVVIGTGLTMVDVALHLRHAGFGGPVVAISRRGLHPRSHVATTPWPMRALTEAERRSPARLLRRLRREAVAADGASASWHGVVDALRPMVSEIWRGFPVERQQSFLRHARPWWDVHRHRMAPPVSEAFHAMIASGWLTIHAGHVEAITEGSDTATVSFRPRGTGRSVAIPAQRVINASGSTAPDQSCLALVGRLFERGLVRTDRHGLGLDQTDDLALVGANGTPTPRLWALGPLGTGSFWECVAVPDIRQQAARLAADIAARV